MKPSVCENFPPFRLDVINEQLWRENAKGATAVRLRPKTFAVLRYLLEHRQQLVTKDQLLEALWPGTWVTDSALKSCVRELREVLGDDSKAPRFIETVHRRGYRFIGKVANTRFPASKRKASVDVPQPILKNWQPTTPFVGRDSELARLHSLFGTVLNGERRLVCVTGEAGIGKTTLVDAFLSQLRARYTLRIGQAQCIEHYGAGEPYLPIFEALGRLCRTPDGKQIRKVLHRHAPTWLIQMPTLLEAAELPMLQRNAQGATQERMLREMAETLEVLSQEGPLVLALEDLHWSDHSTLELLAVLARRREPARLMVVATYRANETVGNRLPLRRVLDELQVHGYSDTLPLSFLTQADVETYLSQRFPAHRFARKLAESIHRGTEGNPLFITNILDELVRQRQIVTVDGQSMLSAPIKAEAVEIPKTLAHFITRQIEDLSDAEQEILEVASVIDSEFSSALVAALLAENVETIETCCDTLVRQGRFLQFVGTSERPDGRITACYRFVHAFYRDIFYRRVGVNKRVRLHEQIAKQQEVTYGAQVNVIASEVALHFERGRNYPRAVHYHQQAGENALRRSAHKEAVAHFDAALNLLRKLPTSSEQIERELMLQVARTAPLAMEHGYGSPTVAAAYERAHVLSQEVRKTPRLFPILAGLASVYHMRGKLRQAHELEGQLLRIARRAANRTFLLWAYLFQGMTAYNRGQFSLAQAQIEVALPLYDPQRHNPQASSGREDPGILCLTTLISILWMRGYPDQAQQTLHKAHALAEQSADPLSHAMVLGQAAVLHQRRREGRATLAAADAFLTLAQEQGFSFRAATAMIYRGWALADCGDVQAGIEQIRTGLDAIETHGSVLARPYYLGLLGEAYGKASQIEEALQVVKEALTIAQVNDDRFYEAELWRLMGALLRKETASEKRARKNEEEAERCFWQALKIAQQQKTKALELRVMISLGSTWAAQGKEKEAYRLLEKGYRWFTEGFDTVDLQEAKALLERLKGESSPQ